MIFGVFSQFLIFKALDGLSHLFDYTQVTWIFLLKQKSNVRTIFFNFQKMVKT